jgi:GPH family glycoside/pentoside/hexuronide:cation symporter
MEATADHASLGMTPDPERIQAHPEATFSRTVGVTWGFGLMAAACALATLGTQFLFFMTNYVGMSAALAGTILAVAKGSDAFSDLFVGMASDRTKSRWGRRRPWIMGGTLLAAPALILTFNLDNLPGSITIEICALTMLAFYFGYTCLHIPLVAMSSEIATTYRSSGKLWGYGMFFSMLGNNFMGTTLAASLILFYGSNAKAYNGMGWTMGLLILVMGVICVVGTARIHQQKLERQTHKKPAMREWMGSLMTNKALVAYSISETVVYFAQSMLTVTMTYYLFTIVRLGQIGMMTYGMAGLVGSILGLFAALQLMRRVPKHYLAAGCAMGSGFVILGLSQLDASSGLVPFGTLVFVWGIVTMARGLTSYALVPDLIHADYLKTGLRREGAIASITSAIQKTTPAAATAVFGWALAASGYITGDPSAEQPQSALNMLLIMNCLVPGFMMIVSAIPLLFFYDLSERRLQELQAAAPDRASR